MPYLSDIQNKRIEHFLDFIKDVRQGSKILDIGCQSGHLCAQLQKLGYEPYGVEVMKELVQDAQNKYPSLNIQWADCEKTIPFEDNFFDVVWAGDVIEHIRFTNVFINEVNRVLKKGGLFALTTPMHNRLKNVIIALHNFDKHFDPEFPHLRFYTITSLKSVLGKRGFRIMAVKYIGRIRPLSKSMFVVGEKIEDKQVCSLLRY